LQLSRQKPERQNRYEIERFLTERLLELFINSPERTKEIEKISQTIHFDISNYKSVMLIKDDEEQKEKWKQWEAAIRRKIIEIFPSSLTTYQDGVFCVLVTHQQREEIELYSKRLYKTLTDLLQKKNGRNPTLNTNIGMSEPVTSYQDISLSHQQAKQILNILPKVRKNIGYYPQLGHWTLLSYVAGNEKITLPFVDRKSVV